LVSSLFVQSQFLCFVIGQRSGIEELLNAQLRRIILRDLADLVIALTDQVGRQDQTAATESRQNLLCDRSID
jgi:hypothetical protein